eukprot:GHVR01159532.1.p1 GENE.GHVR01159532.1~~GHVR01159532.1.p1  ORF type:complete len:118 (+),score=22.69 GHVR01159532.1:234-587(+)
MLRDKMSSLKDTEDQLIVLSLKQDELASVLADTLKRANEVEAKVKESDCRLREKAEYLEGALKEQVQNNKRNNMSIRQMMRLEKDIVYYVDRGDIQRVEELLNLGVHVNTELDEVCV